MNVSLFDDVGLFVDIDCVAGQEAASLLGEFLEDGRYRETRARRLRPEVEDRELVGVDL